MKSAWYSLIGILILSLGIISCDNVEKPSLINTGNSAGMQPMPVTPGTSSGAVSAQPATAALNPKHGLPGHRCDIPEGAPLNQPAANTTPVINATQSAATPSINIQQQSVSGATAKLNPKHGEPGHRCDIAVGAPLNSAPAAATPTINTSSAAAPATPLLKSAGSVKLNPQHGQPGHRCDIAVGAPL